MNTRKTITLPDGYNGHTAKSYTEPVQRDGNLVKLMCAEPGKEYMIRWAEYAKLQTAIALELTQDEPHTAGLWIGQVGCWLMRRGRNEH